MCADRRSALRMGAGTPTSESDGIRSSPTTPSCFWRPTSSSITRMRKSVIARGAVQINYGGYKLVAQQSRVQPADRPPDGALANIELIEPDRQSRLWRRDGPVGRFRQRFRQCGCASRPPDLTKLAATSGERRQRRGDDPPTTPSTPPARPVPPTPTHTLALASQGASASCRTASTQYASAWKARKLRDVRQADRLYSCAGSAGPYGQAEERFPLPASSATTQKLGARHQRRPIISPSAPDMDATLTRTVLTRQGFLARG